MHYIGHPPSVSEDELDSSGDEFMPIGKNAKRHAAILEKRLPSTDEDPCKICKNDDHPELILLCDVCDNPYHTGCLRPPLMLVPFSDWFCPPCEHKLLIEKLVQKLDCIEEKVKIETDEIADTDSDSMEWETIRDKEQCFKADKERECE